jgi:hypothetical protein
MHDVGEKHRHLLVPRRLSVGETAAPHSSQNFASARSLAPQAEQTEQTAPVAAIGARLAPFSALNARKS